MMPPRSIRKPSKKRPSVTDSMESNAEKIVSGVTRKKIELIDSDEDAAKLEQVWPGAPVPCVVVVPGSKGHFNYIKKIHERLSAEGFILGLPYPHRPKRPGQLPLHLEAEMRIRQSNEGRALTEEQRERIERNKRLALEKLAQLTPTPLAGA